ncbi:MAG: 2'-5' RNA ligase family protein [Bryobacterales bacterium]|nr:2'-5' RNA ligase family protein [Bryobacterales bacterium]
METSSGDDAGPSLFAVVCYVPEELGEFLNRLRCHLVPSCSLLSHITLLPPRTLTAPVAELVSSVGHGLKGVKPFSLELGPVEKFPVTDVVYLSVARGRPQLETIHRTLDAGPLASEEPFPFHPHITLAQEIAGGQVESTFATAAQHWNEWKGSRSFAVDRATLVQNCNGSGWATVAEYDLR